ncbi:MFS general substrate transporter [Pholiota conissans]|uniref:MFS general substrate transporter n=1 Tax=Pholiota conissans TaxID=109636 RepID=A0A9P6D7V6_9AGAR|nr:MFS general substrate transporter [Pholiota conissans]
MSTEKGRSAMSLQDTNSDLKEKDLSKGSCSSLTEEYDEAFERKTMRFIDWRIIPILALVYSFSLIDRINLGSAYTAGMGVDLQLVKGDRYSIVSCIYFVPYILLQLPGNLVLRRFGVRNWLSFIVLVWGAVLIGMGFIHSWGYLILCRVLLGAFEASFFPSLVLIISTWYKRHEVQKRVAVFYLLSVTTGGFSPILAYCMSRLNGKQHIAGWRWIFIIEGAITLFLAIVTYLYIPAFPDQNTFLTPEQTGLVLKRIDEDRGDALPDPMTWAKVKEHLCDWTIWAYGVMFLCAGLPSYAQSFFLPIILRGMGWSQTNSLLLSAPPYGPSIVTTMLIAYFSDKHKHRAGFIVGSVIVCLVGLSITAFAKQNEVRYFGVFLTTIGNSGSIPTILAYSTNNVVSHTKRNVQTAVTISWAGLSGVMATTVFRAKDSPRYIPGLSAAMASQVVLLILVGITTLHFSKQNRLMREGKRSKPLEGQPGFYYTL